MNDFKNIKVAVACTGYVGLSIATLLSQHHHIKIHTAEKQWERSIGGLVVSLRTEI